MIARISSGNFIKGAIVYNDTKVEEGEASTIDIKNFDVEIQDASDAINRMMRQCLKFDRTLETLIKKPVFSCSLNLNQVDLDRIKELRNEKGEEAENEFYRKIAGRYMEGMGYGKQPYIVYKHEDIERTHIHIVSIRVDKNRRKINDTNEKLRSERVRKEIAKEFSLSEEGEKKTKNLSNTDINTISGKRFDYISKTGNAVIDLAMSNTSNVTKIRHKISNILKFVDENYQPKNINEYNKILAQFNIKCNKIDVLDKNGRRINGCQFGVINDKGEFISHLMKGGLINEKFTLPKLETKFALANGLKNDIRKEDAFSKKYITEQIKSIFESPREIDIEYFTDTLRVRGIETNLVRDNDEKIIGINFIDNLNGKVFSGSSLGREFTFGSLSSKIEKHNKILDDGILEKTAFSNAIKKLTSSYNEIRKDSYYLESDLIKKLPSHKEALISTIKNELLLTDKQAEKCFNTFCRYKKGHLPSIEVKENGYQQSQIITALVFASHMKSDQQSRVNFLHQMGISLKDKNGSIIYTSDRKPDVWLSFSQAKTFSTSLQDKDPIIKVIAPNEDLQPFGKTERQFIKDIAEGGNGSQVKGSWIKILDLLDKPTLESSISESITSQFTSIVKPLRTKALKEFGHLESDFIRSIEYLRIPMVNEAMRNLHIGKDTANAIFDKYKSQQNGSVLQNVETREQNAVINRLNISLKFAELIEDPSKKSEFLKRMEISVEKKNGSYFFFYDKKKDFSLSEKDIKEKTGIVVTPQNFIFAELKNVQPFSKKERDFVKDYISSENMMDGRNATALSYLNKSDQDKVKAFGVATRVSGILNGINTRTADEMVRSLLYRGFVIHPIYENGETTYKVSRFNNKSVEAMATLPKNLADRLDNSNFVKVYPKIKEQLLAKGVYGTAKLVAVMKISRAADFNDTNLLHDTINDVAKVNNLLADKMREAAKPQKNGYIDYGRVARLVAEYNGEKIIKLPPTTVDSFICNERKQMETIVNELRNGNLDVAIKLIQGTETEEEIHQRKNKKL